ncbi:hypothetical protein PGTUg99_030860 [Puccinia graminis f. sp. tritici]|uniref:Uncharacterized protein n=1 Tax=Puccinia graminis f. sp. tritici TaxID=56615 RepID=A0A5B0Q874_PUCGR|nr:hypothetical protein PGTUg99_030860 [Puccinia graminis f. sp. tritici]
MGVGGSLADQEESLLVGGTTSPAEEGILLVGEVVQPRRPGGHPPGRRGCTTSPAKRELPASSPPRRCVCGFPSHSDVIIHPPRRHPCPRSL